MSKWLLITRIIELLMKILVDSDKDGRPDMFDEDPDDPKVK